MERKNLPKFLLIGASRSGTTTLYHQLREHPDICMPVLKEINFFSQNWEEGIEWYSNHFIDCDEQKTIGEASTTYTWPQYPDVPSRIASVMPDVQLIYLMRNPIERAFSHYRYYKYQSNINVSFLDAIEQQPVYLSASRYAQCIHSYLDCFDRSQLHFILAEEFFSDPDRHLSSLYSFLGVKDDFVPRSIHAKTNASIDATSNSLYSIIKSFSTKIRRPIEKKLPEHIRIKMRNKFNDLMDKDQKSELSSKERSFLIEEFREDIKELENLMGRKLDIWREN
jgi:hypothetical protein